MLHATVCGSSISGDAVVLAVPYGAVADVISEHGDGLRGKVVVDISNPVDWATFAITGGNPAGPCRNRAFLTYSHRTHSSSSLMR